MEIQKIAPETLLVANSYLRLQSLEAVATELSIEKAKVSQILDNTHVRRYIDRIFLESGYMNKYKLAATVDTIIEEKLQEMQESELTSKKDIIDILTLSHKMRTDEIKLQMELSKIEQNRSIHEDKLAQTDELTTRKIEAAETQYKLRRQDEEAMRNSQFNAYNNLIAKLLEPKEVVAVQEDSEVI